MLSVLLADIFIYIPAVVVYCLYLVEGTTKKRVRAIVEVGCDLMKSFSNEYGFIGFLFFRWSC